MPRILAPRGHSLAPQSLSTRDRHLTLMRLSTGEYEVALMDRGCPVTEDHACGLITLRYGSLTMALYRFRRMAERLSPGVTSPGTVPTHPSVTLPR